MTAIVAQLEHRAKAIAGAVLAATVTYATTALTTGNALTAHGLEGAAAAALLAGLGVHQVPNAAKPKAKPARKP